MILIYQQAVPLPRLSLRKFCHQAVLSVLAAASQDQRNIITSQLESENTLLELFMGIGWFRLSSSLGTLSTSPWPPAGLRATCRSPCWTVGRCMWPLHWYSSCWQGAGNGCKTSGAWPWPWTGWCTQYKMTDTIRPLESAGTGNIVPRHIFNI